VKAGLLFPLNSVATRVWQLCDGQRTAAEIVAVLAAEFDADTRTIHRDVDEFLQALLQRGLVSLEPTPAAAEPGRPSDAS
jgi:pyrroloquinoline quinone biosynthesis protein D